MANNRQLIANLMLWSKKQKQEQKKADTYNAAEVQTGKTKDNNFVEEKKEIAKENGTPEYKSFIRKHRDMLESILGVRSLKK